MIKRAFEKTIKLFKAFIGLFIKNKCTNCSYYSGGSRCDVNIRHQEEPRGFYCAKWELK